MSEQTENLNLPYIMPNQAQKHVTHNEAIRMLDAVVQLSVMDDAIAMPPSDAQPGSRYIIGSNPTGDWVSKQNQIAAWQDGQWAYYPPEIGWLAYVAARDELTVFDGQNWISVSGEKQDEAAVFGINTRADETNRLAAKTDAVLFSHDDVTPGTGDMRFVVNKAGSDKTGSVLFQSNWSGRLEIGLSGEDNFAVKVSDDGADWKTAIQVDAATNTTILGGPVRIGGSTVSHDLHDFCEGEWTPTLGPVAAQQYSGATGLTVDYGQFTKIGSLVTILAAFRIEGLDDATLTQKSTFMIEGLPYPANSLRSSICQGGVAGFVYKSFGGATNTPLIGGFAASARLYLSAMATGVGDAGVTNTHFLTATYLTD